MVATLISMPRQASLLLFPTKTATSSLLAENQDCGVEPKDRLEDTYSAAPVAQNLTDLVDTCPTKFFRFIIG